MLLASELYMYEHTSQVHYSTMSQLIKCTTCCCEGGQKLQCHLGPQCCIIQSLVGIGSSLSARSTCLLLACSQRSSVEVKQQLACGHEASASAAAGTCPSSRQKQPTEHRGSQQRGQRRRRRQPAAAHSLLRDCLIEFFVSAHLRGTNCTSIACLLTAQLSGCQRLQQCNTSSGHAAYVT